MKLIVINSYDKLDRITSAIHSILPRLAHNTCILLFKSEIPEGFERLNCRVTISEDYLRDEDYRAMDNYVFKIISKDWDSEIKERFRNVFIYKGVELARAAENELQKFLIVKVKAAMVLSNAVEKERPDATFIIDTNSELAGLDIFLHNLHGITSELFTMKEVCAFRRVREYISSFLSSILDLFAGFLIKGKRNVKIIDARLFYKLEVLEPQRFILSPFENGLRIRLRCLVRNGGYLAFHLGKYNPTSPPGFDVKNLKERFKYNDILFWDLVEEGLNKLISDDFVRIRNNMDILMSAHNRHDIKGIVLRNDVKELEKTIVLAAKIYGLPTLVIQHGILTDPNGHSEIFADRIALWGARAKRWYEMLGGDPGKMTVVGSIGFDEPVYKKNSRALNDILSKFNFAQERPLVTLIGPGIGMYKISSFTTDDVTHRLIRAALETMRKMDRSNLVIKLHPNEEIKTFLNLIKTEDAKFAAIVKNIDLRKLIWASQLVLTLESTAAFEAVLMEKPIVVINLNRRPNMVPYVERGVAIGVSDKGRIADAIEKTLYDKDAINNMKMARKDFISDFIFKTDGKTKSRISELIDNI